MKRVFLVVLDSFGVGALPDAAAYGDEGSDTLLACAKTGLLHVPNLEKMGLFQIDGVSSASSVNPFASYGRMAEASKGKDTTTDLQPPVFGDGSHPVLWRRTPQNGGLYRLYFCGFGISDRCA